MKEALNSPKSGPLDNNPQSAIRNPQSGRPDPRSPVPDPDLPADPAKRATLRGLAGAGLLAAFGLSGLAGCSTRRSSPRLAREPKLILVGLDGLDPRLVNRLMAEGKLPNFSRLKALGGASALTSSIPPQSPVAWASLITGQEPGGHGVYDFIHRDAKTYLPHLSIARSEEATLCAPLGGWRLPLVSKQVELMRSGKAFWEVLAEAGIPASIYRVPSNFPPREAGSQQLAGLGTPDLRGGYGEFSFYTNDPSFLKRPVTGGTIYQVSTSRLPIRAALHGPPNSLRRDNPDTTLPLEIWLDPDRKLAKIAVGDRELLLHEGEWSDWVSLSFSLVPHLKSVRGICRFYLKGIAPHLKLYVSPINIDPFNPALPIATPADFSRELARRFGRFYTQGFPHDVKALREGVLNEDEYLHQSHLILEEATRMYDSALNEFRRGLLFYYFATTDRTQHMFWSAMDPRHPAYDPALARVYGHTIEDCYRTADGLVGRALAAADGDTTVIAMSDHGFGPYYRSFNLNTWLAHNGYLAGRGPWQAGRDLSTNADWENSLAYGLGFNALYLNLRGREAHGCVTPERREKLEQRLVQDLLRLRDPETGERVIANVYRTRKASPKLHSESAPDLIIGYRPGYRCSDRSVLGEVGPLLETNLDKWSGDHCFDAAAMPGVLFANRPFAGNPGLTDITASVLAAFDLTPPPEMTGNTIWSG